MKLGAAWLIAIVALGAPACGGKKKDEPPAATGSAVADPGSAAGSAADPAAAAGSAADPGTDVAAAADEDEVEVPTEVDFETDAAAKITEQNLEAQVKAVEQELGQ